MTEIFVLAEHRRGQMLDITYEVLTKGKEVAEKANAKLVVLILGKGVKEKAKTLPEYVNRVLIVEDSKLENFNSDAYQKVLSSIISEQMPLLTMMGHTSYGMELAPRLAASLRIPIATDCIDLSFEGENLVVIRQMYGGKVNVKAVLKKAKSYMVTVRPGAFIAQKVEIPFNGEVIEKPSPLTEEILTKRFIKYILPSLGEVDITAAEKLVGVGRGIKDQANLSMMEEFAKAIGAVLASTRPVIDKGWLPSDRQVGISGKTVKPKLYFAVGISGAFHHVLGMKNSNLIIAINKDPNAPIFYFSDYGIVDDLFKIVPELTKRLYELKG
jgi:electron transfer flavoprotein alpha subunit